MLSLIIGNASAMANDVLNEAESEVVNTSEFPAIASVNDKSDALISRNIFVELGGPSLGVGIGVTSDSSRLLSSASAPDCHSQVDPGMIPAWFDASDLGGHTDIDFKGYHPFGRNCHYGKTCLQV